MPFFKYIQSKQKCVCVSSFQKVTSTVNGKCKWENEAQTKQLVEDLKLKVKKDREQVHGISTTGI